MDGIENGNFQRDEFISSAIAKYSHGKKRPMISLRDTEEQIVSSDIIGMSYGSLFDGTLTMCIPSGDGRTHVEVAAWYDNENSYTTQMVRTIKHLASL